MTDFFTENLVPLHVLSISTEMKIIVLTKTREQQYGEGVRSQHQQ